MTGNKTGHQFEYRMRKIISIITAVNIMICLTGCGYENVQKADAEKCIRIPVLMYHGLTECEELRNQYMIHPSLFEDDLRYLMKQGYTTIFVSELVDYFENGKKLPEKPVILTFDDGYLNNYTYAFPLLKKYRCKAVISPIGISADEAQDEKYRSPKWSQCKWEELKEMSSSGLVQIENHTFSLHKNTETVHGAAKKRNESDEEYEKRLKEDLTEANNRICKATGRKPCTFVYPFGAKSESTEKIVRSLGFKAILDCESKMNVISSKEDLFHIHRFLRPDRLSAQDFMRSVEL